MTQIQDPKSLFPFLSAGSRPTRKAHKNGERPRIVTLADAVRLLQEDARKLHLILKETIVLAEACSSVPHASS